MGDGVGVREARAGGRQIKRGGAMAADRLFDQHRGARHGVIWCEGGNDDQVYGVGSNASNRESAGRGNCTHRGGGLTSTGDVSLADAGARADPLVARLHDLLKIGVGDDRLWNLVPPANDVRGAVWQCR